MSSSRMAAIGATGRGTKDRAGVVVDPPFPVAVVESARSEEEGEPVPRSATSLRGAL